MESIQIIFLFFALVLCAFLMYDGFGYVEGGYFDGGNDEYSGGRRHR